MSKNNRFAFRKNADILVLSALGLSQAGWLFWCASLFTKTGYLPSPFFYDKQDTFMDFFNTLYWVFHAGRYTDWASVYPPINFFLIHVLWIFGHGAASVPDLAPADLRAYGAGIVPWTALSSLVMAAFVFFLKPWTKYPVWVRCFAFATFFLSAPFLEGVERGNLVIFCPFAIALVMARPERAYRLLLPILVNIKPYFLIALGAPAAARNRAKSFLGAGIAAGIFVVTGVMLDLHFWLLFKNLFLFDAATPAIYQAVEKLCFPSSLTAFSYALHSPRFLQAVHWSFRPPATSAIEAALTVIQDGTLAAALFVFFRFGRILSLEKIFAFAFVIIMNLGMVVGGYTLAFYGMIFPVLMEMKYRPAYLALIAVIFAPLDCIPVFRLPAGIKTVFLTGHAVNVQWTFTLGGIVHPLANLAMLGLLIWECVAASEFSVRRKTLAPEEI